MTPTWAAAAGKKPSAGTAGKRILGEPLSSLGLCGVGKVDARVPWYKLAEVYPTDLFIFPKPRVL